MINDGDKFSGVDLIKAIDEITSFDTRSYVVPNRAQYDITHMTPTRFSKIAVNWFDVASSAGALDTQLREKHFRTTYRFAHDYRIPGFTHEKIVSDAYKLDYFYRLATNGPLKIKGNPDDFARILDDAARVSYYFAQYIWAFNPDARFDYAKRLHPEYNWGHVLAFLLGVGYRFHPKDVYQFVMRHNDPSLSKEQLISEFDGQLEFKKWCLDNYGVDTGCLVLCPEHQEKLRKILTKTDTPYLVQLFDKYVRRR
ncbi:MAG: hypothetical protein J6K82_00850 [Alphaproteobacteria bacterium]|nr:hypothetical protein [Alphaproteobacteria bacterium]